MGPSAARAGSDWLQFTDYLSARTHESSDWIVVALRRLGQRQPGWFVMSALLPDTRPQRAKLFGGYSWGFSPHTVGHPTWNEERGRQVYYPDAGAVGGLKFRALTISSDDRPLTPAHFELLQEFVLYHDAAYDAESGEWTGQDLDGTSLPVGRRFVRDEHDGVEVAVDALREFLCARRCLLVRAHDVLREGEARAVAIPDDPGYLRHETRDATRYFCVTVQPNPCNPDRVWGGLLGFDVVRPFEGKPARLAWYDDDDARQYTEFVVGTDEHGHEVALTCDARRLPHGPSGTLAAVYFTVDVLDRYRTDSSRYSHDGGVVRQHGFWCMAYDINPEGLVQVWLKDLGLIPHREQLHWRAHNVRPRGGISESRWQTDFMAEFLDEEPLLADRLWSRYDDANAAARRAWGFDVFRPLSQADAHVQTRVAWPIADRALDLDDQIAATAKLLCESVNIRDLSAATGRRVGRAPGDLPGANKLLEAALAITGVPDSDVQAAVGWLHHLQALRSCGVAHPRGADWDKARARAGIKGLRPRAAWDKLIRDAIDGLAALAQCIEHSANAWPPAAPSPH